MNNKFSEKQFIFFILNYIMGFGFIATISSVIQQGYFGILIFGLTSIITLAVALVFSRLGNEIKEGYGGSYQYAKKAFNKGFAFFQGWNQFIQGPILAATSPLFIASALESVLKDNGTALLAVRITSIAFFIILVGISTLGIGVNKKIILASSIVKWAILLFGIGIAFYFSFKDLQFSTNLSNTNNVTVFIIFSNVLSFMYAFGGIEDVASMAGDVKIKNFRRTLMISFAILLTFYFVVYIVLNGIGRLNEINNFSAIYNFAFGSTGVIIFAVGLVFNGISGKISISIASSRKIIPLATDGYLPAFLTKQNKKQEYKWAIIFGGSLTMLSMLIFWLLPFLLNLENFFNSVIELGTMAFLIQYMLTMITAIYLHFKKKINKIPLWELIIYIVAIIIIATTLLIYVIPPIVGEQWKVENTIIIVSYVTFIGFGYLLYFVRKLIDNNKKKKQFEQDSIIKNNDLLVVNDTKKDS